MKKVFFFLMPNINKLKFKEYNEKTLEKHPTLQKLQKELNLNCNIGYIQIIKIYNSENDKTEWLPLELYFGIPLGNLELNQKVCNKIEKFQLLSNENLIIHSKKSRELCLKLLDFISEYQSELNLDGKPPITYPNKKLIFSNGKIIIENNDFYFL